MGPSWPHFIIREGEGFEASISNSRFDRARRSRNVYRDQGCSCKWMLLSGPHPGAVIPVSMRRDAGPGQRPRIDDHLLNAHTCRRLAEPGVYGGLYWSPRDTKL